jgi:hypothetical protein
MSRTPNEKEILSIHMGSGGNETRGSFASWISGLAKAAVLAILAFKREKSCRVKRTFGN